jgi:hypothetical protein
VANTEAYYDTATITAIKSFAVQAPEVNFTTEWTLFAKDKETSDLSLKRRRRRKIF